VDRRSPSPYTEHHGSFRRLSHDRSPARPPVTGKLTKKRSYENFSSIHDFSESKSRSPGLSGQLNGTRSTKSPLALQPPRRGSSPLPRVGPRCSQTGNPFLAVPSSKASLGLGEKNNPAYFNPAPPYVFPQPFGGFSAASPYLHPYFRQAEVASSSSAKPITAIPAGLPTASTSQLYRPPTEVGYVYEKRCTV